MTSHSISRLNPQQQSAVKIISGPVLVLAGAGSGKTGVITHKIAYLIRDCGYKAYHVVALTFTNKAAREMKERAAKMLKKTESKGLWVSTFHTLGLRILKEEGHRIGLTRDFSIFDQKDCFDILKDIVKVDDVKQLKRLQSTISNHKNDIVGKVPVDEVVKSATEMYNDHLLALNAVDFDDLIIHCLRLFADYPDVLAKWQRRIRYLLLDEYQDTNQAQYHLIKYLAGVSAHFTAVGDDDQSIYSWRGAEVENLKLLSEDFPNLQVVKLEQNYRCDRRILSSANALIAGNRHLFEKRLWSQIDHGESISVNAYDTEDEEALSLVTDLLLHHSRYSSRFNDYAVLYRGNYQSRLLEKHLRMQRVPYVINGATSFFEHTEVRDLLAYLRVIANPDDQRAFVRIVNTPKREIGTTTLQRLSEYARKRHIGLLRACLEYGLSDIMPKAAQTRLYEFASWIMRLHQQAERGESIIQLFDWIMGDTEYEDHIRSQYSAAKADKRIELVGELRDWLLRLQDKEDVNSLSEAIQRMLLLDMLENKSEEENRFEAVSLMTLHAAKGLEFPYVFIVGLEEGLLPHANCIADEQLVEEERRLLYVGMTRAKRKLTLSLAKNRKIAGNMTATEPSRFLGELPADEIEWSGINERQLSAEEEQIKRDQLIADLLDIVSD
ncbi:MAG: ATP-dependent DNA helicase Rep [Gammaproteobacteria bacterium]|nr:MAG: ATP-dependent DNA helicase Rep [Gammaproteobacteria bacterium]